MTTTAEGVLEIERRIAARPETVFSYFTDSARFTRWFGIDAELDPQPGGLFKVTATGHSRWVVRGTFVEIEPPTRLVYTWGWEAPGGAQDRDTEVPPGSSTVEVTLTPDGESTILRLRHSGLPSTTSREFHSYGWGVTLDRLVIAAAGGDPGPDLFADR